MMRLTTILFSVVAFVKAEYSIDYFNRLRAVNSTLVKESSESTANSQLFRVVTADNQEFQLAQLTIFLPFSNGSTVREEVQDDLAVSIMSMHHFNNPELGPHLTPADLEGCNVKLTAEFYDTEYSPIDSTRLFTSILQRSPPTLQTPKVAGVIGAYRSAVTSPLAILTGVNDIPQVSYASTSTDFDVKEQYPYFGRTVQSSTGEAQVALEFFQSLNATHVGVLFVTDAFGSALQKAFQDAASEAGIVTDSVAFSYSADPNGDEIPNAVKSLQGTQFRLIYVIAFEVHYNSIMKSAYAQGLTGDDYLWIFNGLDIATFQRDSRFPPDSPLAKATRGVGSINVEGGIRTDIRYPDQKSVPPLSENPITSYEKYRIAWRETMANPDIEAYIRSQLPESVKDVSGYDPNFAFSGETNFYTPFLYDAITGLGLSYCRAAMNTTTGAYNGKDVFEQFRYLDFEGASGRVKIIPESGTRDYKTEVFTLFNVQENGVDENGLVTFKLVPTSYYQNGWKSVPVEGQVYVFGGGSTTPPQSLPSPDFNFNYIGNTGRAVGYTLMGIVVFGAIVSILWLVWFRTERVVRSSQPLFLLMVAMGALIMASTIVPLSLEEPLTEDDLDIACMSAPWLYVSGAVVVFSALLAKTRGVHQAYTNPNLDFIHVTSWDILGTFVGLFMLNMIVLLVWTFLSPLEWNRIYRDSTDMFDRPFESYGICSNDDALPYVIVILVLNITILIAANWWAYQSRNIETEYHESRYVGISMASILQAWCMGIPILIVVWDNPQAKFFVQAGIVFVTALAVLLLVFVPKMLAIHNDRVKAAEESKRIAYTNFTARSRRNQFEEEEQDNGVSKHMTVTDDTVDKDISDSSPDTSKPAEPETARRSRVESSLEEEPNMQTLRGTIAQSIRSLQMNSAARDGSVNTNSSNNILNNGTGVSPISETENSLGGQLGVSLSPGADGLRITHNPRSERNLRVSGGVEYSRAQMEQLEQMKQEGGPVYLDDGDGDVVDNEVDEENVEVTDVDVHEDPLQLEADTDARTRSQ